MTRHLAIETAHAKQLYPLSEFRRYWQMREDLTHVNERKAAACVAYCRGRIIEIAGEPMASPWTASLTRYTYQ